MKASKIIKNAFNNIDNKREKIINDLIDEIEMENNLKASELRIGNLINCYLGAPISETMVITVTAETLVNFNKHPKTSYEPIPLTEEWLLKFGFTGHDYKCPEANILYENVEFTLDLDESTYINIQEDFSYMLCDLNNDNSLSFEWDYITYVHELQNLYFALAGKELEIKE